MEHQQKVSLEGRILWPDRTIREFIAGVVGDRPIRGSHIDNL